MNPTSTNGEFSLFLSTSTSNDSSLDEKVLRDKLEAAKRFTKAARTQRKKSASIKFSANNFVTQSYDSFDKHYEIIELLGEGGYGEVYICEHKESGARRAVKILQVDSEEAAEVVLAEFNVLRGVDHPNLLKIYQLYADEENGAFYIVSDLYQGGELYDEIESYGYMEEKGTAIIMNQVLGCINYIHSQGIMHRDLKPENILLADDEGCLEDIKIIDFGLAAVFDDYEQDKFTERAGSSYYIAPEVLKGEYGPKADVWSVGVILFILLCGEAPFDGDTDEEIIDAIYNGVFSFEENELWDEVSDEAKDFVQYLLTYEDDERPTAEEALKHPWLVKTRRISSLGVQKRASNHGGADCQTCLSNLEHFRADSKLKQAACAFISSQLILKHEKDVMDELFRAMDTECDGKLSKEELKAGFATFLGRHLSDKEVDDIFERVNYSCSGAIEYSEFIVASITLDESRLQATFNEFDQSNSGVLNTSDLMKVLNLGNHHDAEAYVDKILKQIYSDHDGFVSFEEFRRAMVPRPVYRSRHSSRRASEMSFGSAGRRSTLRRSTQINFGVVEAFSKDPIDVAPSKPGKDHNSSGIDDMIKSWHSVAKNTPRKLRTCRSFAVPHAISMGYARRPSRVQSRVKPWRSPTHLRGEPNES